MKYKYYVEHYGNGGRFHYILRCDTSGIIYHLFRCGWVEEVMYNLDYDKLISNKYPQIEFMGEGTDEDFQEIKNTYFAIRELKK